MKSLKRLTIPLMLVATTAFAGRYDDPALDPMQPSGGYDNYGSSYASPSSRYFGNDSSGPDVVVPIQPGSGPSYISRDQVMTDHQYCTRSVVDGALVCQSH